MNAKFERWNKQARPMTVLYRDFIEIAGDLVAGTVLSQIVYWFTPSLKTNKPKLHPDKSGEYWIKKSYKLWAEELCISEAQVKRSFQHLAKIGIVYKKSAFIKSEKMMLVALNIKAFTDRLPEDSEILEEMENNKSENSTFMENNKSENLPFNDGTKSKNLAFTPELKVKNLLLPDDQTQQNQRTNVPLDCLNIDYKRKDYSDYYSLLFSMLKRNPPIRKKAGEQLKILIDSFPEGITQSTIKTLGYISPQITIDELRQSINTLLNEKWYCDNPQFQTADWLIDTEHSGFGAVARIRRLAKTKSVITTNSWETQEAAWQR